MNKKISPDDFLNEIKQSKNIAVTGFRWTGTPQLLLRKIRQSFDQSGKPNGITIIFTSSATDPGIDFLAHPKLLNCSYGSYYGSIPKIRALAQKNLIKAYSFPQGQISLLFREIARGSPGLISKVGINTYVDPKINGGKINHITKRDMVFRMQIDNKDYLFYKSIPIDTVLIRGSIADLNGNISMIDEPIKTEFLSMAQAGRTSGGKIFVQVLSESKEPLSPELIDLPSHLVDGYIVAENPENDHRHTNKYTKNISFLSKTSYKNEFTENNDPIYKSVIARKALNFIVPNSNVILGQGLPELVGINIRKNRKKYYNITTFMESGVIGGIPERRPDFGVAFGPKSFLTQDNQFVGFNGGHMDIAVLSFVEFDENGNVNVSVLGDRYYGCGGYIDICHAVKTIIFVGSFTAKGLKIVDLNNKINIINEGKIKKARKKVEEITFASSNDNNFQNILIITERCIFKIEESKVILVNVFPGIDLQKDILNQMDFKPLISDKLL